ncbi:MAG: hypothetical protein AAB609_03730 [Patescibacteria group bacterium]
MIKKRQLVYGISSFLIFLTASLYITFPLVFHLGSLATGLGDELVIAWIQNWVIHSLTTNPFSLFEANIYYPFHNSLAFSDLFLTSSILSLIPLKIIGEPIATVNFTLISSLAMLGFFTYLLIYYLTKDFCISVLGGMLIIFSPAVLDKVVHLQILSIQWVPLSILFFIIFIRTQKTRYLIFSLISFLLQTYNSFLPGYFIAFSLFIISLYSWFYDKKKTKKLITKNNILFIALSITLIIPIVIPYYSVSNEFAYTRDIRDAIHFAIQPEDLLYPGSSTRLKDYLYFLPFNQFSQNGEFKPGYLGLVLSLLCIFALYYFIRNFKKNGFYVRSFITISLLGFILSLGPVLHLGRQTIHEPFPIVLPYTLFYYILPGFQGFRNSSRWEMLFIFGIVVVITLILHNLFKRYSSKRKVIIYLLLFVGIIAEFSFPMHFEKIIQRKDFPLVYSWLAITPRDTKIIELPIYNWNMWPGTQNELLRQYYSTSHFRKMVNGYTGFSPPPWQNLVVNISKDFPSDNITKLLKQLNIDYIVMHKKEYDILSIDNWVKDKNGIDLVNVLYKNKSIKLLKKFGNDYVFSIN